MSNLNYRCINCKHAFLDESERVFHRLSGKDFIFDCLNQGMEIGTPIYKFATHCTEYQDISQLRHSCIGFEECP